jgi:hypothetical protein
MSSQISTTVSLAILLMAIFVPVTALAQQQVQQNREQDFNIAAVEEWARAEFKKVRKKTISKLLRGCFPKHNL